MNSLVHSPGGPRAIYVHIPFCQQKCYYCDFYSQAGLSSEDRARYVRAISREIEIRARFFPGVEVDSIYIGGGTPSLLEGRLLVSLMRQIQQNFSLSPQAEITLEANPATLSPSSLGSLREAGINRLSLGAQSFCDPELKTLGRSHQVSHIMETVAGLHGQGWENFNLDLIYGIPGQSIKGWKETLQKAVDCSPAHLSLYLLQVEPSTPMGRMLQRGDQVLLGEDTEWSMYEWALDFLAGKGFEHYEISNFCRSGRACQHNLVYWRAQPYLGFGSGAVSYLGDSRLLNLPGLGAYCRGLLDERGGWPVEILERMDESHQAAEALMLGLRICQGVNLAELSARFRLDLQEKYQRELALSQEEGLLNQQGERVCLTRPGYFLSNRVFRRFLS